MEEDTVKTTAEPDKAPELLSRKPVLGSASSVAIREPLYELIGRKRTPPSQLDFQRTNAPTPSPAPVAATVAAPPPPPAVDQSDVWIPRRDWVAPSTTASVASAPTSLHVWQRRPTEPSAAAAATAAVAAVVAPPRTKRTSNGSNSTSGKQRPPFEDHSIYGRLWEAASNGGGGGGGGARSANGSGDVGSAVPSLQPHRLGAQPHQPNVQEHGNQTGLPFSVFSRSLVVSFLNGVKSQCSRVCRRTTIRLKFIDNFV